MSIPNLEDTLTPKQIVEALDKYIVGQYEAKKHVAIALRNRWRARHVQEDMQKEIMPNNILMIGPTGVGKTEIARRLAHLAEAPFVKVEASKFTEVGYVGRDVESMVRDLMEQSVRMVEREKKEKAKKQAMQVVEERILDILIPPVKRTTTESSSKETMSDQVLNEETRKSFLKKIQQGDLDDKKISIEVQTSVKNSVGMVAGGMIDDNSLIQLQEMLGNMMPKRSKRKKVTIEEAKKHLLEEELNKHVDPDEVKEEAARRAQETGIIFIDEIDKIASKGQSDQHNVSQDGVQRDLLPIVEGSAVNTKYGVVHTDQILFVAAGAFHMAKPSDLIPELQGRFPIRIELDSLTKEDFIRILSEPKNALTKQYTALLESEDVKLQFKPKALDKIAAIACELNNRLENIGARRLHTVMSTLLNDSLFHIPEDMPPKHTLSIGATEVQKALEHLLEDDDLSRYML